MSTKIFQRIKHNFCIRIKQKASTNLARKLGGNISDKRRGQLDAKNRDGVGSLEQKQLSWFLVIFNQNQPLFIQFRLNLQVLHNLDTSSLKRRRSIFIIAVSNISLPVMSLERDKFLLFQSYQEFTSEESIEMMSHVWFPKERCTRKGL